MKSQTMRITVTRIMVLYLLSILGKSTIAFDETISSIGAHRNFNHISPIDINEYPNKRSYSYVSEYKRLPVYMFGLGKRNVGLQNIVDKRDRPYSFGLGKRSGPYDFGIGKKNDQSLLDLDYPQFNSYNSYYNSDASNILHEKRANRMYDFGIGKRSLDTISGETDELSDNIKRSDEDATRKFLFGLGKRNANNEEIVMMS